MDGGLETWKHLRKLSSCWRSTVVLFERVAVSSIENILSDVSNQSPIHWGRRPPAVGKRCLKIHQLRPWSALSE